MINVWKHGVEKGISISIKRFFVLISKKSNGHYIGTKSFVNTKNEIGILFGTNHYNIGIMWWK